MSKTVRQQHRLLVAASMQASDYADGCVSCLRLAATHANGVPYAMQLRAMITLCTASTNTRCPAGFKARRMSWSFLSL